MPRNSYEEMLKGRDPWDHIDTGDYEAERGHHGDGVPYRDTNSKALGVNQRSAVNWQGFTAEVQGWNNFQPAKLIDRMVGRKSVLILVPSTAAAGVYVDSMDSSLQASGGPAGFLLPIGSSITLDTEGPVWAISALPTTNTLVSVAALWG